MFNIAICEREKAKDASHREKADKVNYRHGKATRNKK